MFETWRMARWTIAVACIALSFAAPESVGQQNSRPPFPDIIAPGVVLSFEGGQPGNTVADVLGVLKSNATLLRQPSVLTRTHIVKDRDSICQMLAEAGYPLPCGEAILNLVDELNPKSKPVKNGLQLKQEIVLPAPDLYKYSVTRYFPATAGRVEADDILKNWARLNAAEMPRSNGGHLQVRYDAYRMFVATKGDEESFKLAKLLIATVRESENLKLDMILKSPKEKQQGSLPTTADEWEKKCNQGALFNSTIFYRDMSQVDREAMAIVEKAKATPSIAVPVHIVDVALNTSPTFSPPPTPGALALPCRWTTYRPAHHHSTHMAAIIASRNSSLGFMGLAPNATVDVVEWLKANGDLLEASSATRSLQLGDKLSSTSGETPMHVYLIATVFPQSKLMVQPPNRFREALATRIQQTANLFVIAAGQNPPNDPVELSHKNDTSPQNLGDLSNVVVVTACNPCTRDNAKLMPEANYSYPVPGQSFVHVAAPGGAAIAAWVNSQHVAAAVGTSQATAYVTGVAAAMIGRYKDAYRTPESVKRRLQATSQPTTWAGDDGSKVAAGTVDPVLAMLDPKQHWIKRGGNWDAVKIKSLTTGDEMVKMTDGSGGAANWIYHKSMLRFVQTVNGPASDRRWEIYQEMSKAYPKLALPAVVNRVKNLVPTGGPITLCDNSKIAWADISDLIIAEGGIDATSCASK